MSDATKFNQKPDFGPAVAQLKINLDTMLNNEPINRREGNNEQADLELENAASFKAAISLLGRSGISAAKYLAKK